MARKLYQIIVRTPTKRKLRPGSHIEKFLEREIMNSFTRYRERSSRAMQIYSSQIIFNNMKRLAELGKKYIALKYVRAFEKEMNLDFIKLN